MTSVNGGEPHSIDTEVTNSYVGSPASASSRAPRYLAVMTR